MKTHFDETAILAISRPEKTLWTYYLLRSLVVPPLFPVLALVGWFRYHTMRYHFSDEGVSMSWGVLFRREVILNYARIQDIHLRSNVVERWFGLARILVQTASGSASAEMTLEGLKQFEQVRDFLYSKMRGIKDASRIPGAVPPGMAVHHSALDPAISAELAAAMRDLAAELRGLREALEAVRPREGEQNHV
jgi:membrane protein YdbS with pleckstrin-like domain